MLEELVKLANELDQKGLYEEADALDAIIKEAGVFDFLGFRQTRKQVEPEKSPYEKAIDRLDRQINSIKSQINSIKSQINSIKRNIKHLSQAGDDITEDMQNEKTIVELRDKLVELRGELVELEKKRDYLIEKYYHMMIPK